MIPVSCRSFVELKEDDGTLWRFLPKSRAMEDEALLLMKELKELTNEDFQPKFDAFIKKILIGFSTPIDPSLTVEKLLSTVNRGECWEIVGKWNQANELSVEQKKS
jgi:hypothetical protein